MKASNQKIFDCEQCGNPLYKSAVKDSVRCCYCGYVNRIGRFQSNKREKNQKEYENCGGKGKYGEIDNKQRNIRNERDRVSI